MKKLFAAFVLVTIFSANMSATPVKISFNYFGGAPMGYRTQVEFNVQENWVSVVLMNSWENWRFMLQAQEKEQQFATRKK